ncbi:hypothetical protein NC652_024574 [Populus alba x Populus x berolinensis]|nr:hypothetical protein NC652_024574 [Populus alba x Populus x berolinensis]
MAQTQIGIAGGINNNYFQSSVTEDTFFFSSSLSL